MWRLLVLCTLLCLPVAGAAVAAAQNLRSHALFAERCGTCHKAKSGAFSPQKLVVLKDDRLVGKRHSKPLEDYFAKHFGRLQPNEIAILVEMFDLQARSGDVYARKCRSCHDRVKRWTRETSCRACHEKTRQLAQDRLLIRDGQLTGRYTGKVMKRFLANHGRLSLSEAEVVNSILAWQLRSAPKK